MTLRSGVTGAAGVSGEEFLPTRGPNPGPNLAPASVNVNVNTNLEDIANSTRGLRAQVDPSRALARQNRISSSQCQTLCNVERRAISALPHWPTWPLGLPPSPFCCGLSPSTLGRLEVVTDYGTEYIVLDVTAHYCAPDRCRIIDQPASSRWFQP